MLRRRELSDDRAEDVEHERHVRGGANDHAIACGTEHQCHRSDRRAVQWNRRELHVELHARRPIEEVEQALRAMMSKEALKVVIRGSNRSGA